MSALSPGRRASRSPRTEEEQMQSPQNYLAVIKVVGIGGGGTNAVNRMIESGLKGVEFVAMNTDAQALLMSDADAKLDTGRETPGGRGAGATPELGPRDAGAHQPRLRRRDSRDERRRVGAHGHRARSGRGSRRGGCQVGDLLTAARSLDRGRQGSAALDRRAQRHGPARGEPGGRADHEG